MTDGARAVVDRVLRLVRTLTVERLTLDQLSERLEVARRTIYRDIDMLTQLGLDVQHDDRRPHEWWIDRRAASRWMLGAVKRGPTRDAAMEAVDALRRAGSVAGASRLLGCSLYRTRTALRLAEELGATLPPTSRGGRGPLTDEDLLRTVRAVEEADSVTKAADALNLTADGVYRRLRMARKRGLPMPPTKRSSKAPLTDEDLLRTVRAVEEAGSMQDAADALNLAKVTVYQRLQRARKRGLVRQQGGA